MSMTVRRAFTTNFRRLLVEKDYTMKGFADESGFDYSAIWAWVNGRGSRRRFRCPLMIW